MASLTPKRRITQVDGVLGLRGRLFYGNYPYIVTARGNLAFHLDVLAVVTCQRARIRHQPGLAVFSDQAFSILADFAGDGGCFGCRGLTLAITLTGCCSGQQQWNQKKRKDQFFHRGSSSIWSGTTLAAFSNRVSSASN